MFSALLHVLFFGHTVNAVGSAAGTTGAGFVSVLQASINTPVVTAPIPKTFNDFLLSIKSRFYVR